MSLVPGKGFFWVLLGHQELLDLYQGSFWASVIHWKWNRNLTCPLVWDSSLQCSDGENPESGSGAMYRLPFFSLSLFYMLSIWIRSSLIFPVCRHGGWSAVGILCLIQPVAKCHEFQESRAKSEVCGVWLRNSTAPRGERVYWYFWMNLGLIYPKYR